MFERAVLHLDLDSFFVSVERLKNSALQGRPLIIGGSSQRGVVASCSYEARHFGVRSAMPMKMALRLCPDAIVLKGDMESYSKHSKLVSEIIKEQAPVFEKSSIDEFYLDLTGMDKYIGCWKWSTELRERVIRESGLPISFGLASNKLISKMGTSEAKPNGSKMIIQGAEKAFIWPMSVKKIPSIGKATYKKLSFMGVRKIETLAAIPPNLLQREFGKNGMSLWRKANAIDESPVVAYHERKSISTERTFRADTIDVRFLKDKLTEMCFKLAFELRQKQKLCSCVTIKIRYTDFNTYTKQCTIPYTSNDNLLLEQAHRLFEELYKRRQLVRLIGLRFSSLVHGNQQINLFENNIKESQLLQQLDHIRKRFGNNAIQRGSSISPPKPKHDDDKPQ